jgi:lysine 2,3-aminomutase
MTPAPFVSKRAPAFAEVPDEKWNDWRWQLSNRLNSVEDFEKVLKLTESERKALGTRASSEWTSPLIMCL